jgi:hypothetical protein
MAISDTQKVDYLWKKIGYAATKTDTVANKEGYNEAIPSPLQIRGDKVMTDSGLIPGTIPVANTSIVSVYTTSLPIECTNDATASTNRTWKTNVTDWISPEFGSTYQVKVYVNLSNSAGNAASAGTQLFASGSGNNDEWFFDYQSGVLNFIGTSLPSGVNFTGKSVYVSGAEYTGGFGVAAAGSSGSVGNLTISNVTISANSSAVSSSANIIFSTSGTGAVQFTGNAIGLPLGNILQRPTTVNAGYLRFNTEYETIEVWDGYEWVQTSGGVITSDVLNGDGSTAQFALSANTTTTGVLVSINGTIQKPSTAYTVSNNSITFTEIPALGDSIEVRKLAGGTISVNYGNADVAAFLTTYPGLYSNVQASALITTNGLTNYSNVNVAAYVTTNGLTNYSNVNVAAYVTTNGLTNFSNVNVAAYVTTNGLTNFSNVNVSALITTNGLTNFSNVNVAAYVTTNGLTNFSNVNVSALITTNGLTNYSNVNASALITTNGLTNYSNVNVASYLAGNITVGNITAAGATITGFSNIRIASGSADSALQIYGNVSRGGAGYHDFLRVTSTASGATNPNKYFRLDGTGNLQIINSAYTSTILSLTDAGILSDGKGDVRAAPQNSQGGAYTLVVGDAGKHISITTGGVTVNASIFSVGDMVTVFNNSGSSQTITQGTSVTLRLAGTATTGNRTLAQYGIATLLCVTGGASPVFACTGAGLT